MRTALLGVLVALTAQCGSEGPTEVEDNDVPSIALSSTSATFVADEGGPDPSTFTASVTNSGDGILSGLSASVTYASGQPTGWLSASIGSTSPTSLTLAASTGTLAAGTYNGDVAVSASGASNSPVVVAVTFTVNSVSGAPPAAPSSLGATAVSTSQIDLTWTDNANNETGFEIDRCAGAACTTFSQVVTVGANATTYQDTGLSASTTYRYRVRATNGDGDSGNSNTASATTNSAPSPPAAPSGLGATAVSTSQINLSWTDNAGDETGFRIEQCSGSGCSNFVEIGTVGANVTGTSVTSLNASTLYRYRVRAFNAAGNSTYSNIASATTNSSQVEATYLATFDNLLLFNSTDGVPGNTAYPSSENAVGYNFFYDIYGFLTGYLGFASLIYFDDVEQDLVDSGRTILEAKLVLNLYTAQGDPVGNNFRLAAVGTTWNPNTVSWNYWVNNMTHYDQNVVNFSPWFSGAVAHEIDVTDIVQNWADGDFSHFGFQIWEPNPSLPGYGSLQAMAYESLELYNALGRRPMLYVRYQ